MITCRGCGRTFNVDAILCYCGTNNGTALESIPIYKDIATLAAVCLTCPLFRQHSRGARCTHKQCGCNGREDVPTTELHGVAFSPQLVNLLRRRASCPDGRW